MACQASRSETVFITLDALKRGLAASTCRESMEKLYGSFIDLKTNSSTAINDIIKREYFAGRSISVFAFSR
jgi:hypothetical protein